MRKFIFLIFFLFGVNFIISHPARNTKKINNFNSKKVNTISGNKISNKSSNLFLFNFNRNFNKNKISFFNINLDIGISIEDLKFKSKILDSSNFLFNLNNIKNKKKVLVFMSRGGGGHISVSNALKQYLQDYYDISVVNFFDEVVPSADLLRTITFGKVTGEDFYNFCLQYRFTRLANFFVKVGGWAIRCRQTGMEKSTYNYINQQKPDLIVSVIPMVNHIILNVAEKLDIPFLVVTNDLDTRNYIHGMSKVTYKKFYYALPFNDTDMIKKVEPANIPHNQIIFTGFPLRPEFINSNKNRDLIYQDFNVSKDKKVVMILMGGNGSYAACKYVQELSNYNKPIHIVVCLGRDEKLKRSIEKIALPSHITISLVGFTNRIADLMSIANVLITKSGPGSICEAIASDLPMIIDKTGSILNWENMNIDLVKKHQFGEVLTNITDLNNILTKLLDNANYSLKVKKNMVTFKEKIAFDQTIKNLVKNIVI